MSQSLTHCPVCQGTSFTSIFSQPPYTIIKCLACHQGWLSPMPTVADLNQIYGDDSYFADKQTPDGLIEARRKLRALQTRVPAGASVLDFGCGTGHFIQAAASAYKMSGFDISAFAAAKAQVHTPFPVKSGQFNARTFTASQFDAIVLFDVIEHLPDFRTALKHFHRWLKPGGWLILTTPDLEAWDAKLLGRRWYGYTKIPQHLHYFSQTSFRKLLPPLGYRLDRIQLWGFSRSYSYLLNQMAEAYRLPLKSLARIPLFNRLTLTLPMVDLMLYAQKTDH